MVLWIRQTTSKRLADRKVAKFQKNITKRGSVPETPSKKGYEYPVGPILLGFFVFVVIGSCKLFKTLFTSFTIPVWRCAHLVPYTNISKTIVWFVFFL